jgi:multicomponent Na+:H+ antiporter subunit B
MVYILLFLWIVSAVFIVREQRIARLLINLGVLSFISSVCFLLLAAPDVAMAQLVISVFTTIIFIVSFEKFYVAASGYYMAPVQPQPIYKTAMPVLFVVILAGLFIYFIPGDDFNTLLKEQYIANFRADVGGSNAVTAVYLGYRMYDTLLEALMLLVGILAIIHLSHHEGLVVSQGRLSDIRESRIAVITIRLICPIMVLFCIYLVLNGHLTAGGGFQGGVVAASLFVCRYLIHDIYDIPTTRIITFEKLVFVSIFLLAMLFVFIDLKAYFPEYRTVYLIAMNSLIGLKVACGFYIVFYRFIAFERS